MASQKRAVLRLVRERKLADLLAPRSRTLLEASGVFAKDGDFFVVFDNTRRAARIEAQLLPGEGHKWMGGARPGGGYEAITYSADRRRFYLLIEAEKHPDGTYKAVIEEYDEDWRYTGRKWVDFPFESRNTGFEGLAALRRGGRDYLLALCEGNRCRSGKKGSKLGKGRIHVLLYTHGMWQPVARIKLPREAKFKDYSGMAIRGDRLVVVSQQSSRLWVGRLNRRSWAVGAPGRVYDFPRTKKGKMLYCTVEGVSWLSPRTVVAVSDLRRKKYPERCERTDQSIHIFQLPT
jgi:hypothetical protein